MPLTCTARVYKKFPSGLADNVTAHVKKRADTYRLHGTGVIADNDSIIDDDMDSSNRCKENPKKKKHEPVLDTSSSIELPSRTKRARTPLCSLRRCVACAHGPGRGACRQDRPAARTTHSCGCCKVHGCEPASSSVRDDSLRVDQMNMELEGGCGPPCSYPPRSRAGRPSSRTTVSLDNVDLWESDEEVDSGGIYDKIDGVLINPRKTFDFSEFRRLNRNPLCATSFRQCWEDNYCSPSPSKEPLSTKSGKVQSSPRTPLNQTVDLSESRLPLAFHIMNSPLLAMRQQQRDKRQHEPAVATSRSSSPPSPPAAIPRVSSPYSPPNKDTSRTLSHQPASPPAARRRPRVRVTEELLPLFPSREPRHCHTMPVTAPPSGPVMAWGESRGVGAATLPARATPHMACDSHVEQTGSSGRKVTFSNLVRVREGDSQTLGALRHSNNSAQWIKQKYLSKPQRPRQEASPVEGPTDNWQLAF